MSAAMGRVCRLLSALLFVVAGLLAGDVLQHANATMVALFAFALWVAADVV